MENHSTLLIKDRNQVSPPIPERSQRLPDAYYVDLIARRFLDNRHLQLIAGYPRGVPLRRIWYIVKYSYELSKRNDGLFISSNGHTVGLYYIHSRLKKALPDWWNYLKMVWNAVGVFRIPFVLGMETRLKRQKPKDEDHIHVWFLAQEEHDKTLIGLTEFILHLNALSEREQLPIFIETSNRAALIMYRRAKFDVYRHYVDEPTGLEIWYMRKDPQ